MITVYWAAKPHSNYEAPTTCHLHQFWNADDGETAGGGAWCMGLGFRVEAYPCG